jgi:hypothetical protein
MSGVITPQVTQAGLGNVKPWARNWNTGFYFWFQMELTISSGTSHRVGHLPSSDVEGRPAADVRKHRNCQQALYK